MKTFDDLKFNSHPSGISGEQATMFFENGYGISVVSGPHFYTSHSRPYEAAVLFGTEKDFDITYDTHITDDVIGYLNPKGVTELMKQIQEL